MKIYQVYYILKSNTEYTTYVGTDRAEAFGHGLDNARISVWIHRNKVEDYSRTGDKWTLEHNAIERIEKEIAEWTADMETTKLRLENGQKAIADHKRLLAALKSE
jgi:hypothetical protein